MSAAANNLAPKWVMLEPFVSRRDKDWSIPDDGKATIKTSGTTSWNAPFSVTFKLAEPPGISRLYAHLPGFPGGPRLQLLSIMATHQDLVLFNVRKISVHGELPVQDLFIFKASDPCSLKMLPHCIGGIISRPPSTTFTAPVHPLLSNTDTGLLRQGEGFVVAEAKLSVKGHYHTRVHVEIYWLRSTDDKWNAARTRIVSRGSIHDFRWKTNTVISVRHWLCWIDYYYGILFGDMSQVTPTLTLVRFPPGEFTSTDQITGSCWLYRGVSAIDADSCLKFVKVDRNDCVWYGPLKRGAGFTITCHTLPLLGNTMDMVWEEDYTVTSKELWDANPGLRRDILMLPQVNIDRPHVVHFLISGSSKYLKKNDMWVATIDMKTKKMESCDQYINAKVVHGTEDADLAEEKSDGPLPFIPCEFSKFFHL